MQRHLRSAAQWLGLVDNRSRRYQRTVSATTFVFAIGGYLLFGFWGFAGGMVIVGLGTLLVDFLFER